MRKSAGSPGEAQGHGCWVHLLALLKQPGTSCCSSGTALIPVVWRMESNARSCCVRHNPICFGVLRLDLCLAAPQRPGTPFLLPQGAALSGSVPADRLLMWLGARSPQKATRSRGEDGKEKL